MGSCSHIKNFIALWLVIFIMKSFAIIALLGVAQAISCAPSCGSDCQSVDGTGQGYRASLSRGASVPCGGGVGTLTTQLAGFSTEIGAQ